MVSVDGEAGNRGAAGAGGDGARDQGGGAERPRRVVDEHDARAPGSSASRPARTEACRVAPPNTGARSAKPGGRGAEPRDVVAVDHRLHRADLGHGRRTGADVWPDHRLAAEGAVLLGQIAPGAEPAPGCDDRPRLLSPCMIPVLVFAEG